MISKEQKISDRLSLIAPVAERDAPLSIAWMNGESGQETQQRMGIPNKDVHNHTIEEEKNLIQHFIDTDEEIVWMIRYDETIIGAVEVKLQGTQYEKAPTISIMIGDLKRRGMGLGTEVMREILDYLHDEKSYNKVYARYLVSNIASQKMNERLGFHLEGDPYRDEDGLQWQNVKYEWANND